MEHLMHELVGRSLARERDRDVTLSVAIRQAESRRSGRHERPRPPRRRTGGTPLVAHA